MNSAERVILKLLILIAKEVFEQRPEKLLLVIEEAERLMDRT